jgi:hypothetical protein
MRAALLLSASLAGLAACTPYAPDLPEEPFYCGSGALCPDGYACVGEGSNAVCAERAGGGSGSASSCKTPATGVLATWSFANQLGTETSVAVGSAAPGVVAGAIARSAALTPAAGAGSISSSNWPTTAHLDMSTYYTLTVAPPAGCVLDLDTMDVDAEASQTGPASAEILTSADNFLVPAQVFTAMPTAATLQVTAAGSAVELRLFGYFAATGSGTLALDGSLDVRGEIR